MFDEFQRIGQVSQRKIHDINAGINTLYNSCDEGLAIILSYSFGVPENIKFMVSGEVLSRVERQFALQMLSESEATIFIEELIEEHRVNGTDRTPFEEKTVKNVVQRLSHDLKNRITPRLLMQCFTRILEAALALDEPSFPLSPEVAGGLYAPPVQ